MYIDFPADALSVVFVQHVYVLPFQVPWARKIMEELDNYIASFYTIMPPQVSTHVLVLCLTAADNGSLAVEETVHLCSHLALVFT